MNIFKLILIVIMISATTGCAQITETAKLIWGSSTRALENARDDAISKTYRCSLNDCYNAVLALAREERVYTNYKNTVADTSIDLGKGEQIDITDPEIGHYDVFINDRKKKHIVVMGIRGNVDTTEAGIFFSQPTLTTVKLEVTSLSSSAKRNVAEIVFANLDLKYSAAE